jgi:LuxR family maltose regulon positive regulatory protein
MDFIKVPAAYDKLKCAEKDFRPVYISAVADWGKSAAVQRYYKNKPVFVISGNSGTLSHMPDIATIRRGTVVIEDISWLTDADSRDYVKKLLTEGSKHVILISRAAFPQWMSELRMQLDFLQIGERDLQFGKGEIADYMRLKNLTPTEEELEEIWKNTRGYPPAVAMYGAHMASGEAVNQQMYAGVCGDVCGYFDQTFFSRWEQPVQELLLALCQYPEFTLPMAELLTGSHDTYQNLCYCHRVGNFLIKKDGETWTFRERFAEFLQWKRRVLWTEEMYRENYRRAALYYAMFGDVESALVYYQKAGLNEQVKDLLIQNAQRHPGRGHYYEMKDYYMALPEDVIKESPVLMCGMSMLHSIMFQPEQAEKWYQALEEYRDSPGRTAAERKEAKIRLAYLDIGLAHRAGKGILKILRKSAALSLDTEISLPELSVTSNLPSLMNGGLDFCDWSLMDNELAKVMAKPLEIILKKQARAWSILRWRKADLRKIPRIAMT